MISEELKNDLKIKWDRMRDGMAKMGMDACLLTVDVNLYYTTGQIYSGYFYLPVDGEPVPDQATERAFRTSSGIHP